MNEIIIPQWEKEEYINTQTPFEWLYKYKDNKFVLAQLKERIKIQAGAIGVKNFVSLWNAYLQTMKSQQGQSIDNVTQFENQEIELYSGDYNCDEGGITTFDRMGFEIVVCNHPIMPVLRLVNIDTGAEKLKIAYRRGKIWRSIVVDKKTIASANSIVSLAEYGIAVNSENAKYLVKYFTEIEHLNYDKIEELNSVGRLGWIDGYGFSPYVDNIVFDGDISYKHIFESVSLKGRFEKWVSHVKEIRKHNIISRIILAASFGSVLVKPCSTLPFFVHLWGGTESGKTVALMMAASVWASPKMGDYIHTFNSTIVGQELSASFVNSLPLIMDELQIVSDRKDFDKTIYSLTEGIGKTRGAKAGGLQKTNTWQNCILTTGEMPISNPGSGAGAVNRVIEIDCKDEKIFKDPKETVSVISRNYGFAGRIFVELLQDDENIQYAIDIQKEYFKTLSAGESTEKQAMAASIVLTADKLIEEWIFRDGITLKESDLEQFLSTKSQVSQNERALEWILDFVISNQNKFKPNTYGEYQGEVWGEIDSEHIYIVKTVFESKMKESGYNSQAFLSWAKRQGIIECADNRTTKKKRLKGINIPVWCVCIKTPNDIEFEEIDIENGELPF